MCHFSSVKNLNCLLTHIRNPPFMKHYISFLLCLISFNIQAAPQVKRNFAFKHYTIRDGLAQMQVMCSFQDSDGYLWLGTKGGVSRWDGNSFKNYLPEDGFPSSHILSISEWNKRIVVLSRNKLILIHPDNSIQSFSFPNNLIHCSNCRQLPISNNMLILFSLRVDTISISKSNNHHLIFDSNKGSFTTVRGFDEEVLFTRGNRIYTYSGVYAQKNLTFKRLVRFPNSSFLNLEHDTIREKFYLDFGNSICIYRRKGDLLEQEHKISKDPSVIRMRVLPDGTLFYEGLKEQHFYPSKWEGVYDGISGINELLVDNEKNLWLCTEKGLYNFFGLNIEEYTFGFGNPDNIWSIVEDEDQRIWLGSFGYGLWALSKDGRLNKTEIIDYVKPPSIPLNHVYQYMGSTKGSGNSVYVNSDVGLTHISNGKVSKHFNTSVSLYAYYDSTNQMIYHGGHDALRLKRGLYVMSENKVQFHPWTKSYPLCIEKDNHGVLRIGASNGQGRFVDGRLVEDSTTHEYNSIICMRLDTQGRLWKGTEKGIFVETVDGKEHWVSKDRKLGTISSMVISKNRYLVLGGSTSFYIADIAQLNDLNTFRVVEFGYESGFTGLSATQNGSCVDHAGNVWMPTALNVLKFDPEKLVNQYTLSIPKLRIATVGVSSDNFQFNNFDLDSIVSNGKGKPLSIDPEFRYLRFELVSNTLASPQTLQFRYRLIGLTKQWSQPIHKKEIRFMNLDYGKYRLEVQCSLDGIQWSALVRSPEVKMMAPFWMRPIMLVLYLLLLLLITILATRWLTKRKSQKELDMFQRKKMENELQLKTLRSKVIPHFTKNVLSSIGHFSMTDKLKAGYYISIFSKFTELTMANADKIHITLEEEIQYLRYYLELEKMRFGDQFDYSIEVQSLPHLNAQLPPMTLHTYCDNAIRHGIVPKNGKGLLTIEGEKQDHGVLFSITDNGIGRARAAELNTRGNGQGLNLIQSYLVFYNQKNTNPMWQKIIDLTDEHGTAIGTRIELFIPDNYTF